MERSAPEVPGGTETDEDVLIGSRGSQRILESLTEGDPMLAIRDFQTKHCLQIGHCVPIFQLTDLLGYKRSELFQQALASFRGILLERIRAVASAAPGGETSPLHNVLASSFPYRSFPEIRPVVAELLQRVHPVPVDFLRAVAREPDLFNTLPMEVRRRAWEVDVDAFKAQILPLIQEYCACSIAISYKHARSSPKERRAHTPPLKAIVNLIGSSAQLYAIALGLIRLFFVSTGFTHYASLRLDLLLAMQEEGISEIFQKDPCSRLAIILDRMMAPTVSRLAAEPPGKSGGAPAASAFDAKGLFEFVEELLASSAKDPGMNQIFAEVGLIANDLFSRCALYEELHRRCELCIKRRMLPRNEQGIVVIVQILDLSVQSRSCFRQNVFTPPESDPVFVYDILPEFMSLFVDRQVASLRTPLTGHDVESDDAADAISPSPAFAVRVLPVVLGVGFFLEDLRHRVGQLDARNLEAYFARLSEAQLNDRSLWDAHPLYFFQICRQMLEALRTWPPARGRSAIACYAFFFDRVLVHHLDISVLVWESAVRLTAGLAAWNQKAAHLLQKSRSWCVPEEFFVERLAKIAAKHQEVYQTEHCQAVWKELIRVAPQFLGSQEEIDKLAALVLPPSLAPTGSTTAASSSASSTSTAAALQSKPEPK